MIKYLRLAIQFVCYNIIQLLPLAVLLDTLQMPNGSFVFGEVLKEIALTQGKVSVVDDANFGEYNRWQWCALRHSNTFYAVRAGQRINGKTTLIYMHREIINAPDDAQVDHINGDGLDNRIENLRVCTASENMRNRKVPSNNTSGYKGVSWDRWTSKWRAGISTKEKNVHIGRFDTPEDAARAYNEKAKEMFGEFARLNIID